MLDEDEIPEPKPLVSFAYLSDDEEKVKPDILDKYEGTGKIPFDFGKNRNIINSEIKQEILEYHKVKQPEDVCIPQDIDLEEDNFIGPPIPKDFVNAEEKKKKELKMIDINRDDSNSDEEMQDEEEEDISKTIPLTHMVELLHTENKSINSVDIDRAGNRLVTGSYDGTVKIWDFTSLTRRPSPMATIEASDGLPVLSVSWAPSGGFFLTATGDCQAKVFDRDGNFEIGCLKGDNYLHDIGHTKGHTYPLTDGKWHPLERNLFITASRDSTVRIWDIYSKPMGIDQELMQITVLKAKTFKNHKIAVNSCNYSNEGNMIIGGVNDGSIQIWSSKGSYWKPEIYIGDAHKPNSEVTSVLFSEDNYRFFSRGDDSTMKMWDIRSHKKPIHVWENIHCFSTKLGMSLSPDESMIMTGTSVKKGHDNSSIQFYSTYNYEKIKELKICRNSITSVIWNGKLNQIAVAATDGICRMYFDPELSKNGIVHSIFKKAKIREVDDFEYAKPIITPLVLPLFDEINFDRSTYLEKISPDEGPKSKAELPTQGPGSKFARPPSVTQYIMTNMHKTIYKEGDARDVLLSFSSKNNTGEWVDSAYKNTQPKHVFDHSGPLEDEVKFYEQAKRNRCHGCGLKFCSCKKSIFQLPIPKLTQPKYKNF